MIDIIYQYIETDSAWKELRYSIRSLYANFTDPFRLWIIGEYPQWLSDIHHIPHHRKGVSPHPRCYDQNDKLETICHHPEISEQFILMYDDVYFLQPTSIAELEQKYAVSQGKPANPTGVHQHLVHKTIDVLEKHSLPNYNGETHLPRLLNKTRLRMILKLFRAKEHRLLAHTLYTNFVPGAPQLLHRDDDVKLECHGRASAYGFRLDDKAIDFVWDKKRFLNHNDAGLTQHLKAKIEQQFPLPSPHEK